VTADISYSKISIQKESYPDRSDGQGAVSHSEDKDTVTGVPNLNGQESEMVTAKQLDVNTLSESVPSVDIAVAPSAQTVSEAEASSRETHGIEKVDSDQNSKTNDEKNAETEVNLTDAFRMSDSESNSSPPPPSKPKKVEKKVKVPVSTFKAGDLVWGKGNRMPIWPGRVSCILTSYYYAYIFVYRLKRRTKFRKISWI
jgi:hypothetical protein